MTEIWWLLKFPHGKCWLKAYQSGALLCQWMMAQKLKDTTRLDLDGVCAQVNKAMAAQERKMAEVHIPST